MKSRIKKIAAIISISLLSACGGSSQESEPATTTPPIPTFSINGYGIKGGLINSDVFLYQLDIDNELGRGALLAEGKTNSSGEIVGLTYQGNLIDSHYLLEFSANDQTIDAISNKKPAISNLRVIIKEQEIVEAKQFYASPLTTLKTFLALRYSNGNINSAYEDAQNTVNAIFSPFNNTNEQVPLLINGYDESQQIYTYYYRQASEGLAALLVELKNVTGLEMDVLFREVSDDLSDGKLDAISASEPLSYKPENLDVIHNPIQELFIPGTTEKLSQLLSKLSDEAEALTGEPINILINSAISESPLYIAGNIDFDNDGSLNHIDMDDDNDGYDDSEDKFPFNNTEYLDTDGDRIGNNADTDDDNDGVPDLEDAFPLDANEHVDTDNDGIGNNADNDDDNDGFPDASDAFPLDPTEHLDTDLDGIGNNKDDDDDNDGVNDDDDAFPLDPNEYLDTDLDGIGNNADTDDDNDGVPDTEDAFPLDNTETVDTDRDGIGNNADTDDDNDGVPDNLDAFPLDNTESVDTDSDGIGNNADTDDDNDGVPDTEDAFPLDNTETVDTDRDGIGNNADTDDDNDGVPDIEDEFPLDNTESVDTDSDGIGNNADTDDDNDGVPDNEDAFPLDNTESVDTDNDGIGNNADTDDDNDGVPDTEDAFPLDNTESVDTDSDGIGNNADTDDDNDGVLDNDDAFPLDPSETDDFDLDGIGDNADNDDDNDLFTDNEDFLHAVAHHPSSTIYESSNIIFKARGFYTDETKLSASDNWHIQYQIFDRALNKEVPFYSDNGYYNAQFDFQKLNWVIDIPAPDYSGEFYINLTLYCSSGSNICGDKDLSENFFQVQQKVPFTVECTKTPCGYNPGSAQGINISKSQSKNYIKDATSSDNGNLLAFYSSDQTPNASYVSLSEDAGNSWSIVGTFPENSINGVFLDETRLIFTCDSAFCMAHSNNSKDWSKVNLYNDSDFLINHKNISNYSLKLNGFVHKLESAYSVFFTDHSSNKSISYVTRTTDFVNWSSPQELVNEQEDFDFYTYKIIQANDQGYFGLFTSQLDYSLKLMQSEDGVTWSVINSFDFVVAGDLLFENNKLSLYFQYYGERGIYQIVSYDLLNFTPMKKVIDDVDTGVEVLPLSSNEHGILFNQEHDYINDVYFKKVDH